MYEPIHGSAPDISGQGIANLLATILSAAMMLRYTFNSSAAADRIEQAVNDALDANVRTAEMGNTVVNALEAGAK